MQPLVVTRRACYFTPADDFGGAEQALFTLIAGLDRNAWRPVLIHHSAEGLSPLLNRARRLGVELVAVPPMPDGALGARRLVGFIRTVRALRPAVFHAHLTWPLGAKFPLAGAVLARVPAVLATVHLFPPLRILRRSYLQHRLLARAVGRYVAVSDELAARLAQELGWPRDKIRVVLNGVDVAAFTDPVERRTAADGGARPLVLTVARLERQKGLRYLLEASALVPEADFVLAGDGSERAALEAQARALGISARVRFLGRRNDVRRLLAACDVFVLPSLWEGLPLVLLEAMAAGRAVVASAIPGNREAVVDNETGLLVPARDPAALAGAIRAVLENPERAEQFGRAGRARVEEKFSAEAMVRATEGIYNELLG